MTKYQKKKTKGPNMVPLSGFLGDIWYIGMWRSIYSAQIRGREGQKREKKEQPFSSGALICTFRYGPL